LEIRSIVARKGRDHPTVRQRPPAIIDDGGFHRHEPSSGNLKVSSGTPDDCDQQLCNTCHVGGILVYPEKLPRLIRFSVINHFAGLVELECRCIHQPACGHSSIEEGTTASLPLDLRDVAARGLQERRERLILEILLQWLDSVQEKEERRGDWRLPGLIGVIAYALPLMFVT
jgi:hypothetical protein